MISRTSLFLLTTLALIVIHSPAQAQDSGTDAAITLTRAIYAPYLADADKSKKSVPPLMEKEAIAGKNPNGYLTGPLAAAVAAYLKSPEAMLSYDPLVDGQDYEITDFTIKATAPKYTADGGARVTVLVNFKNFGEARVYAFEFSSTAAAPQLEEISCLKGLEGRKFTVSEEIKNAASGN